MIKVSSPPLPLYFLFSSRGFICPSWQREAARLSGFLLAPAGVAPITGLFIYQTDGRQAVFLHLELNALWLMMYSPQTQRFFLELLWHPKETDKRVTVTKTYSGFQALETSKISVTVSLLLSWLLSAFLTETPALDFSSSRAFPSPDSNSHKTLWFPPWPSFVFLYWSSLCSLSWSSLSHCPHPSLTVQFSLLAVFKALPSLPALDSCRYL